MSPILGGKIPPSELDITGGDVLAYEEPRGVSMVLGVETTDEADRVFTGLADGGEVLMPLQTTALVAAYGIVAIRSGSGGKSTATFNLARNNP